MRTDPVRNFSYVIAVTDEKEVPMMSYLNPDLAKIITDERRAKALQWSNYRRALAEQHELPSRDEPAQDALVIELVFPTACETDQIGA
jgi:hypothetical protein